MQKTFHMKKVIDTKSKNNKKPKYNGWFNKECIIRRKVFRKYSKLPSEKPFDRQILHSFIKVRPTYKRTCRRAEKACRNKLTQQLMDVGQQDPKTFWKIITKMNRWGKDVKDHTDNISPKKWKNYFDDLMNDNNYEESNNKSEELVTFEPILDGLIQFWELRDALALMKKGKSSGPDGVYGDCLKSFGVKYEEILLLLIRRIFANYLYPNQWTTNYLKPIHKEGSVSDPGNYRGLAIGPALAKLFSHIMLKRLNTFIGEKKLVSSNQIGFMKGSCTSDHIFLLQTIVEKVVKKNKNYLYVAFIDFKKAYDKVNRKILFERLRKLGINGIFLKNIESMYKQTSYSVKLKNGYLDALSSNLGLKQGCPLSPMLFNLYIDDIKDIFDTQCDPTLLVDTRINHFLYADDLVLISLSTAGLQRCLNLVDKFALDKRLQINGRKSKIIIFNNNGRLIKQNFTIGATNLEPVQSFCYLGFEVKASGTVKHAAKILCDKANKAMKPLYHAVARFNVPVKTAIYLFHAFVSPILLYNAENFVQLSIKELENVTDGLLMNEKCQQNRMHKKFLKFLLGVANSSPSISIMGDTGEVPIILKGFRQMLIYWYRIHKLPDEMLVKKALMENVELRTAWIRTIEKLLNFFQITYTESTQNFKSQCKKIINQKYISKWERTLIDSDWARLEFYKTIKRKFGYEKYLDLNTFELRRSIAKLRCSSHTLEIEKGRHTKKPRNERVCPVCNLNEIETEEHFLIKCPFYKDLRKKYHMSRLTNSNSLFAMESINYLGQYIVNATKLRDSAMT